MHNDIITGLQCGEERSKKITEYIDSDNSIVLAVWAGEDQSFSPIDIKQIITTIPKHKDKIFVALENCGYITDKTLADFASLPLFCASLTWNGRNNLGGGAYSNGGLTALGKKVVKAFGKNNIIIDTAHANLRTFYDIVGMSQKPVINTHSLIYDVYPHRRNINADQIKLIIDTGGIVGITLVRAFVGAETFGYRVIRHIDWFVQRFGVDHLAIGTDYFGTTDIPRFVGNYERLEDYLRRGLGKLGYQDYAIDKILYGNAKEFVRLHHKN
ncbi:MAG: dipeptidase [Firmicutes bacterium]|nr:dipeptidase [Bacillota bacterium]